MTKRSWTAGVLISTALFMVTSFTATSFTVVSSIHAWYDDDLLDSNSGTSTDGNSTDGNSTDGNSTDGNSTDGNADETAPTNADLPGSDSIGKTVADFELPTPEGQTVSLSDLADGNAVVVVFMGTDCPIGNSFVPTLNEMSKKYAPRDVRFVGVYANAGVTMEEITRHHDNFDICFPVCFDEQQIAVERMDALRTPDVMVLDGDRKLRYRGRVDNRVGYSFKRAEPQRADLAEALEELLEGKPVSVPVTETVGCLITPRNRNASGEVTFAGDVAAIIQNKCQQCHHEGTAAPFSLLSYDDVADHSEMIKEVVLERRMPPWHADPRYGEFSNDLRLEQQEIDSLVMWVDQGMPMGDAAELPEPPVYADGWMIDEPDVVFELPETFTVPADGVVAYKYWRAQSGFEEDVWVKAAEARPGNRAVVHHIILYYLNPDASSDERRRVAIVGTAPGEEPVILPDDMGIRIPAGAELLWELHYTPIGREQTDRSQVGLVLCDKRPKHEVHGDMAINHEFVIPANDGNHEVIARRRIRRDVNVITFMPHMHLRGKDFQYKAIYPDKTEEILLSIPNYDFNWQHTYRFAEPKFIPAGTVIECTAHFDNSANNSANPNPQKNVTWGDQTWEEMMIGFMKYVAVE